MIDRIVKSEFWRTILLILVFSLVIAVNDYFIYKKIQAERAVRVAELKEHIKNLQSRINLNVTEINNLKKRID